MTLDNKTKGSRGDVPYVVGEAHPTGGLGIIAYDQASIGMQLGREGDKMIK